MRGQGHPLPGRAVVVGDEYHARGRVRFFLTGVATRKGHAGRDAVRASRAAEALRRCPGRERRDREVPAAVDGGDEA